GYREWHEYQVRRQRAATPTEASAAAQKGREGESSTAGRRASKLSYKDKREYEALPERIDNLESRIAELTELTGEPSFYQNDPDTIEKTLARLAASQQELEAAMERWMELEEQVS
ncbi:MAG: ABC transporter ATP-binding protein, partial [Natronospirillum sp.]|nr:ABC transporter ATP-binding protein [Natronospirillum sp.]